MATAWVLQGVAAPVGEATENSSSLDFMTFPNAWPNIFTSARSFASRSSAVFDELSDLHASEDHHEPDELHNFDELHELDDLHELDELQNIMTA